MTWTDLIPGVLPPSLLDGTFYPLELPNNGISQAVWP